MSIQMHLLSNLVSKKTIRINASQSLERQPLLLSRKLSTIEKWGNVPGHNRNTLHYAIFSLKTYWNFTGKKQLTEISVPIILYTVRLKRDFCWEDWNILLLSKMIQRLDTTYVEYPITYPLSLSISVRGKIFQSTITMTLINAIFMLQE